MSLYPRKIERAAVATVAGTVPALAATPGLSAVFQILLGDQAGPLRATATVGSLATVATARLLAAAVGRRGSSALPWLLLAAGTAALLLGGALAAAPALLLSGALLLLAVPFLERRLPAALDGSLRRRRAAALLWSLCALLAAVQTGRLAAHMTDDQVPWFLTNDHPFWSGHQCLPAYVYAAELHERGEPNIYDPTHYPGLNRDAKPHTELRALQSHIEDPFQYPPQFLLLPDLALRLTGDYGVIRALWYSINTLGFLAAVLALARWVGGRSGRQALWLLPLLYASVPVLQTFQYGQFHLAAIALAIGGMLCFERGRDVAGGGLLAGAVLAKMFPAVLLLPLALQRRWRPLLSVACWATALSALALAVLGPRPFEAFFASHLPRLLDGRATAFGDAWPELADIVTAINLSIAQLPAKLAWLGLPAGGTALAALASLALGALCLAVAWRRSRANGSRLARAIGWLALLDLAVLLGPAGFADYVPATTLWLLCLVVPARRTVTAMCALGWVVLWPTLGLTPMPDVPPAVVMIPMGVVATALLVGINAWLGLQPQLAAWAAENTRPFPAGVSWAEPADA